MRGKGGFTANVEQRRASIERDISQKFGVDIPVKCLVKMPIVTSAYNVEQALHAALGKLYFPCKTMRGTSGGTEWYWSVNWFVCVLAYLVGYGLGWSPLCRVSVAMFFLFFPFAPLDIALCVVLIALAEYAIIGAAAWFLYHLFV